MLVPYDRHRAGQPHASPRRDARFTAALDSAPHLVLAPTFRSVGDSLYLLTFLQAFAAYRTLCEGGPADVLLPASTHDLLSHLVVPPSVTVDWFDDRTVYDDGFGPGHRGAVLITDGRYHIPPGAESHRIDTTHGYPPRYIEHDPTTGRTLIHSSLTARYALWFEELVGVVLPLDPPSAHARVVFPTPPQAADQTGDELHVAVIATASTPARDYGAAAQLQALDAAVRDLTRPVTAHVILPLGATEAPDNLNTSGPMRIEAHPDLSLPSAAQLMAWSDLTVGNNTGMTELAAITYNSHDAARAAAGDAPPVITIFGRYDHTMWTISPRVHAVPSAASAAMTSHNRAHVATAHEWDHWSTDADATSVQPARIAEAVRDGLALTGAVRSGQLLTGVVAQLRHRTPASQPAPLPGDDTIEASELARLVTSLFDLNASNWVVEDQVRARYDDLAEVGRLKQLIDQHNRIRHRLIELIDDRTLATSAANGAAPIALETPGTLADRLTVLAIRLAHLPPTPDERRRIAEQQWNTLLDGLHQLTDRLASGTVRCHVYRALKAYGPDPDAATVPNARARSCHR